MHILIGLITAIVSFVCVLNRLEKSGFDLNSLNPFLWFRRRAWSKKVGTKPIHCLESSLEVAALLVVATAKLDRDISREQKAEIIRIFEGEFNLTGTKAVELFSSSVYLLRDELNPHKETAEIIAPVKNSLTKSQVNSMIRMLNHVAALDGDISPLQHRMMESVTKNLGEVC